jgi:hypothetical protein
VTTQSRQKNSVAQPQRCIRLIGTFAGCPTSPALSVMMDIKKLRLRRLGEELQDKLARRNRRRVAIARDNTPNPVRAAALTKGSAAWPQKCAAVGVSQSRETSTPHYIRALRSPSPAVPQRAAPRGRTVCSRQRVAIARASTLHPSSAATPRLDFSPPARG